MSGSTEIAVIRDTTVLDIFLCCNVCLGITQIIVWLSKSFIVRYAFYFEMLEEGSRCCSQFYHKKNTFYLADFVINYSRNSISLTLYSFIYQVCIDIKIFCSSSYFHIGYDTLFLRLIFYRNFPLDNSKESKELTLISEVS